MKQEKKTDFIAVTTWNLSVCKCDVCISGYVGICKCANVDEWMKKMSMYTMESYLVFKKMGTMLAVKVHAVILALRKQKKKIMGLRKAWGK